MLWREIIDRTADYLDAKGVPESRVAGELLAARLLHCNRGLLASSLSQSATEKEVEAMRRAMKRLIAGEPLQYVLSEWDFRHLTLRCDRRALIPRPETEELVTRALRHLNMRPPGQRPFVVDVGTGTGAIILSLAQEYRGEGVFLGTDVSAEAVELAKENAALTNLASKVKFAVADGLDDFDEPQSLDLIISNPPYIESATIATLDARVRDFEPHLALDGGTSGLDFYDRYLQDALNLLKVGGAVMFEIGESQGEAVRKLMFDYGFDEIQIDKDFAGHDRYACAVLRE